jgi:uncharacterized protein (TIGR00369 family)
METDDVKRKAREQELIALFGQAPIRKTFGMKLRYEENGSAVFEMPYNPGLDHFLGGIHGGVISTLLDNAGWFTCAALSDYWVATAELSVRLLEPVEKVALYSRGVIVKRGSRLMVCEMEVRTMDSDRLVAKGAGTFVITSVPAKEAKVAS